LLLSKGYNVFGFVRRSSVDNHVRLPKEDEGFQIIEGDMADAGSIWRAIQNTQPDEIYNLAAQTHVMTSFAEPEHTGDINGLGTVRILEAIHTLDVARRMKFYQASTSEMFGVTDGQPLSENSPMQPVSPYGAAKLYAYHMTRLYRQAYGMFACNGILFNHESPMRGEHFVTAKIARYVADGNFGRPLLLGNLDAKRDWGHAGDYADGMWRMMQRDVPDDYVLATGTSRSVREFAEAAFRCIGKTIIWSGKGADEVGSCDGGVVIRIDGLLYRPLEVPHLTGNAAKAKSHLQWTPQTPFNDMVQEMVRACSN